VSNFFDIDGELVVVTAHIYGPNSDTIGRLALDTGSVGTVVHLDVLAALGYDVALASGQVRIVTASGIEAASRLVLSRIVTLDQQREEFAITCHALPAATNVEGLLGLDFYRQQRRLVIDFRAGEVTLE
jgi:predicted aspartyl protease